MPRFTQTHNLQSRDTGELSRPRRYKHIVTDPIGYYEVRSKEVQEALTIKHNIKGVNSSLSPQWSQPLLAAESTMVTTASSGRVHNDHNRF